MGIRNLGRLAQVIQGSDESQAYTNTISSRQLVNDPSDAQTIFGKTRVQMLKERHDRLARKYNFSYYTGEEIISPAKQIGTS